VLMFSVRGNTNVFFSCEVYATRKAEEHCDRCSQSVYVTYNVYLYPNVFRPVWRYKCHGVWALICLLFCQLLCLLTTRMSSGCIPRVFLLFDCMTISYFSFSDCIYSSFSSFISVVSCCFNFDPLPFFKFSVSSSLLDLYNYQSLLTCSCLRFFLWLP
jgi:hypothetical protein